jgi:hypothetical protein
MSGQITIYIQYTPSVLSYALDDNKNLQTDSDFSTNIFQPMTSGIVGYINNYWYKVWPGKSVNFIFLTPNGQLDSNGQPILINQHGDQVDISTIPNDHNINTTQQTPGVDFSWLVTLGVTGDNAGFRTLSDSAMAYHTSLGSSNLGPSGPVGFIYVDHIYNTVKYEGGNITNDVKTNFWYNPQNVYLVPTLTNPKGETAISVSSILCHEILEILGDPYGNNRNLDQNGSYKIHEISNPVEGNVIVYTPSTGPAIQVADFVLMNFFNKNSINGPYSLAEFLTIKKNGSAHPNLGTKVTVPLTTSETIPNLSITLNEVVTEPFSLLI